MATDQTPRRIQQMEHLLQRKPAQLSGGRRQRVAIRRAIVRKPEVFLFDEPLSNLDAALRMDMRMELSKLHQDLGATMIYVTHDQVEAMTLADKIVVLNQGIVQQVGSPLDLYHRPANPFVAGFIGSPKMNFLEVAVSAIGPEGITVASDEVAAITIPAIGNVGRRQPHPRYPPALSHLCRRSPPPRQGRAGRAPRQRNHRQPQPAQRPQSDRSAGWDAWFHTRQGRAIRCRRGRHASAQLTHAVMASASVEVLTCR
ncbi:energy-coupling factor transporter ATP-binding protein EcfA2 [Devosia sp. UYZn731]